MRRPEDRARNTGDPEPSEHPTITARNLSCGYHRHAILSGVDLEVSTGEVLCLLGPNGVGKTTLFRTLLGHLSPVAGRVEIGGRERSSLSRRQMARYIAYVPQLHEPPFAFTVFDVAPARMRHIEEVTGGAIRTRLSTELDVARACAGADLVIGAVLVPGARTPRLVTREMVRAMRPGSVLVDIAIDQGGCFEDSRPTTHSEPTFEVEGSIFYCVANMPGAVPHTSTYALTNATLTYALALADDGWRGACRARAELGRGLSTHDGVLYTEGVGRALGLKTADAAALLA